MSKPEPKIIFETPEAANIDLSKPITLPNGALHAPRDSYMAPPMRVLERADNGLPTRWEVQELDAVFIQPDGVEWPAYLIGEYVSLVKVLKDPGDLDGKFDLQFRFHSRLICEYQRGDKKSGKKWTSRHEVTAIPQDTPIARKSGRKAQYRRLDGKSVMTHCWSTVDGLMPEHDTMPRTGMNPYTDGSNKEIVFGKPLNKIQLKAIFHNLYIVPVEEKPKPKLRIAGTAQ